MMHEGSLLLETHSLGIVQDYQKVYDSLTIPEGKLCITHWYINRCCKIKITWTADSNDKLRQASLPLV